MGQLFTYFLTGTPPNLTAQSLPIPSEVGDLNNCSINGFAFEVGPGVIFSNFNTIKNDGTFFIWSINPETQETVFLSIPDRLVNVPVCDLSGVSLGARGVFLAVDGNNNLYNWRYDDESNPVEVSIPTGIPSTNICNAFTFLFGNDQSPNIITDINGSVFTWQNDFEGEDSIIFPVPEVVNNSSICQVTSAILFDDILGPFILFGGVDSTNNTLLIWIVNIDTLEFTVIDLPSQLTNVEICNINSLVLNSMTTILVATGSDGNIIPFLVTSTNGVVDISILDIPSSATGESFCVAKYLGASNFSVITAVTTQGNVISWSYDLETLEPVLIELPSEINNTNICNIGNTAVVICGTTLTCPENISIVSPVPTSVNLSTPLVDSCFVVEIILEDGTVISSNYVFPIGTTIVNYRLTPKRCCTSCQTCCSKNCQFTVTITLPQDIPQEDSITSSNSFETMNSTKVEDWITVTQNQNIRIDLE